MRESRLHSGRGEEHERRRPASGLLIRIKSHTHTRRTQCLSILSSLTVPILIPFFPFLLLLLFLIFIYFYIYKKRREKKVQSVLAFWFRPLCRAGGIESENHFCLRKRRRGYRDRQRAEEEINIHRLPLSRACFFLPVFFLPFVDKGGRIMGLWEWERHKVSADPVVAKRAMRHFSGLFFFSSSLVLDPLYRSHSHSHYHLSLSSPAIYSLRSLLPPLCSPRLFLVFFFFLVF